MYKIMTGCIRNDRAKVVPSGRSPIPIPRMNGSNRSTVFTVGRERDESGELSVTKQQTEQTTAEVGLFVGGDRKKQSKHTTTKNNSQKTTAASHLCLKGKRLQGSHCQNASRSPSSARTPGSNEARGSTQRAPPAHARGGHPRPNHLRARSPQAPQA